MEPVDDDANQIPGRHGRTTWLGSRLKARRDCTDIQPVASATAVPSIVDRKHAQANGKRAKTDAGKSICHAFFGRFALGRGAVWRFGNSGVEFPRHRLARP